MTRLIQRGHDVRVLCSDEVVAEAGPPDPEHESRVERRLWLYLSGGDGGQLVRPGWRGELRIERHNQTVLREVLATFRPQVVSAWHFGALSLGLLTTVTEAGLPMVYAICDDWLLYGLHLDPWAGRYNRTAPRRWLGRAVRRAVGVPAVLPDLGQTGSFLFVSHFTRQRAVASSPWTFPRSTVVFSGIDRADFGLAAHHHEDRPWAWRLLYAGRLDPRKGTDVAIRTLSRLPPEATLSLFGPCPDSERARLQQLADDLGVSERVTFANKPRHELASAYRSADVVMFLPRWDEPFGLVPVEAMACDTPVVATATGGSAEFLSDGVNCLVVPPDDPETTATAVRALAVDPSLRARLVEHGRLTADALNVDRLADSFEAWHAAAAIGYRHGLPADRTLATETNAP